MGELQDEKKLLWYENIERYVYEDMGYKMEEIQFLVLRNTKRVGRQKEYVEIMEYLVGEKN